MGGATSVRVLLVEDNEHDAQIVRRTMRRMLRVDVHSVDEVGSLAEAEAAIGRERHDVGLVDLDIEGSYGSKTVNALRAMGPHLPLVVLTGANDGLALETVRAGAQDFLSKEELTPQILERAILHAMERHRLTAAVARTERMASVGQLSAGVAHELNSPLAQVRDELEEIRDGVAAGQAPEELLEAIDRAHLRLEHMRSTVEALYSFSSAQCARSEAFEAGDAVRLALRLATNGLRHAARVQEDLAPLPQVQGDRGRFTQAVLDLLNHAAEVSRSLRDRVGRVWVEAYEKDAQVVVAVSDDGPPVPAAHRERLLVPFGFTRPGVSSSGIGLAAASEVAKEHGGTLEVLAARHGGVRFELRVPAARRGEQSVKEPTTTGATASAKTQDRARVLWVDDDVHLLRAFQRRLRRAHDVEVCESATEVLTRLEAGERWDVICCDLMMPQMSGREFEQVLSQRYPEMAQRLIFVTGGVFTEEERRFLERTRQPRLLKPFEWSDLLDAVDEVREGSSSAA